MNKQSGAMKIKFKCLKCGAEFAKTKNEIEKIPYQLVDNQLAYQIECPSCHQIDWQKQLPNHPGNNQEKLAKANQKMWQQALWVVILPAIFAVLLPVVLIGSVIYLITSKTSSNG